MTLDFNRLWRAGSIAVVFAFVVVDIIAVIRGGVEATFSRFVLGVVQRHPAIPFASGFVCGHLLWPQRVPPVDSGLDAESAKT